MKCKYCGKEFEPIHKNKKYCSDECLKNSHKTTKITKAKECVICGKRFIPRSVKNVCCSPECRRIRALKIQKTKRIGHCVICYQSFIPKTPKQVCCCSLCEEEHKRLKRIEREKKKKPKIITIEQVARYQLKHREETGEWLSYTDCCKILEEKRNETN